MTKAEMIKTLLGEDVAEFIALDLEEQLELIIKDIENIGNGGVPTFSYDIDEEREMFDEFYHAFVKVLSWYKA